MPNWMISIVVQPIALFCLFVPVYFLAKWLKRVIPDGRVKRALYAPLPGQKARRW